MRLPDTGRQRTNQTLIGVVVGLLLGFLLPFRWLVLGVVAILVLLVMEAVPSLRRAVYTPWIRGLLAGLLVSFFIPTLLSIGITILVVVAIVALLTGKRWW